MGKSSKPRAFKAPVESVLLQRDDYPDVVAGVNEFARLAHMTPTYAAAYLLRDAMPKKIANLRNAVSAAVPAAMSADRQGRQDRQAVKD